MRRAIASSLAEISAYHLPAACEALGLAPGTEEESFRSKFNYVMTRLRPLGMPELISIAREHIDEHDDPALESILATLGASGVDGEFKNLIFASIGPKPEFVLRNAIINDLEITKNAEHCLIYSRPLGTAGLTWRDLTDWWKATVPELRDADEIQVSRRLYARLKASLESPPEQLLFSIYAEFHTRPGGADLPTLIPQVYLHYDPYLRRAASTPGPLPRQRMDFLLLLPNRNWVVIEIDGVQHYSRLASDAPPPDSPGYFEMDPEIRRPDTRKYSEMVTEDRRLRLEGYEVYRFGGQELTGSKGTHITREFFARLLARHEIALPEPAQPRSEPRQG
ncbi:hypothetical protein ACWENQ_40905 [Nonomuraea sp. NPDC004354]